MGGDFQILSDLFNKFVLLQNAKIEQKNMNYNYISVVCPRLNPFASDPIVITSLNQYELRLSTYDRKPGTEVTLTCVDDLQIQGQSVITCQDDGNWNFDSRPYCASRNMQCYISSSETKSNWFLKIPLTSICYIYALIWMIIYKFTHFQYKRLHKWKKTPKHIRLFVH